MQTRSIFLSILGKTNVGKSSILNAIVGDKISIVSRKSQTTRTKITGILTEYDTQIVFFDTPGIHKPTTKLSNYMLDKVKSSITDVDLNLFVIEANKKLDIYQIDWIKKLDLSKTILIINKIDTLDDRRKVLLDIDRIRSIYNFRDIIPISAKTLDGIDNLKKVLKSYAEFSPHFFSSEYITDQPEKVIVSEIIREKMLWFMHDEIPHGIFIDVQSMKKRSKSIIIDIDCIIYCEKLSHKGMIVGKNGLMIKKIATMSRKEIENFLSEKVNLQCWVKVKNNWRNNEFMINNFGFGVDKS